MKTGKGKLILSVRPVQGTYPLVSYSSHTMKYDGLLMNHKDKFEVFLFTHDGFHLIRPSFFGTGVIVPCWFGVLFAGALSVLPWLPWSTRFSLRTLIIAITLLAVVLTIVAMAGR
jgi:hypothetical protein